jgi:high affinity Mn2+ porin
MINSFKRLSRAILSCLLLTAQALLSHADDAPLFVPQWLGAQYTFVDQNQSRVHSPYSGPLSLNPNGSTARSHTFGAYFGIQLPARLQFYLDVEMFKGEGVSNATGLGGRMSHAAIYAGPYPSVIKPKPFKADRINCPATRLPNTSKPRSA